MYWPKIDKPINQYISKLRAQYYSIFSCRWQRTIKVRAVIVMLDAKHSLCSLGR